MIERYSYPRTPHVPWSIGTRDDKTLKDDSGFVGRHVVVTLKMDGENTTIYPDGYMHARSLEKPNHPSQSWVKALAANVVCHDLLSTMRICGENMYAKHTISYDQLPSYFLVFSVHQGTDSRPWQVVKNVCRELSLETVPVIYEGMYDKEAIIKAYEPYKELHEGYVIRVSKGFPLSRFEEYVAKYVNPSFKQAVNDSTIHWASAKVIPNKLK